MEIKFLLVIVGITRLLSDDGNSVTMGIYQQATCNLTVSNVKIKTCINSDFLLLCN